MLLYFIRHGDPIYNPDSLTEKGIIQAEALSNRLMNSKIDMIYSSSSARAIQTAEPTASKLGKEIKILDWCNEKYAASEFGIIENGKWKWLSQSEECLKMFSGNAMQELGFKWYDSKFLNGDMYKKGMKRIEKHTYEFLKELGYEHSKESHCYKAVKPNDKRIALFAHEGFSKAFMSAVLDIPYPYLLKFEHNHTGMTVIEFFPTTTAWRLQGYYSIQTIRTFIRKI